MTVFSAVFLVLQHTLLDEFHRLEHALVVFLRREQFERLLLGDLDIHTHTVGIASGLVEQFLRTAWDALQVDIAIEAVHGAQIAGDGRQTLHRIVGIAHDATAKKQTLDIVTTVELHRDLLEFADR